MQRKVEEAKQALEELTRERERMIQVESDAIPLNASTADGKEGLLDPEWLSRLSQLATEWTSASSPVREAESASLSESANDADTAIEFGEGAGDDKETEENGAADSGRGRDEREGALSAGALGEDGEPYPRRGLV